MIVGLGIDLVEISRIRRSLERFGESFLNRILHPSELDFRPDAPGPDASGTDVSKEGEPAASRLAAFAAARFAAKEAGVKALGTGFSSGIGLHDVRVLSLPSGRPVISFHGRALAAANALGVTSAHLSLTHARETAGAVVVLEAESAPAARDQEQPAARAL